MKLTEALKKSNVVRRASEQDKVFDFSEPAVQWRLSRDEAVADDWQAKIIIEKWIGTREVKPKDAAKK